jgi:hypothetical protein
MSGGKIPEIATCDGGLTSEKLVMCLGEVLLQEV